MQRRRQHDARSRVRLFEIDRAAQHARAIFHDLQAHARRALRQACRQADAVIRDRQLQLARRRAQVDRNRLRPRITRGIRRRFLRDSIQVRRRAFFEIRQFRRAVAERALQAVHVRAARSQMFERFRQAAAFQVHRRQAARQGARALNRVRQQVGDLRDVRGVLRRLARQLHLQAFQQQRQAGELLAEAVVQVAAEPALLAIGNLQDLLLQLASRRDLLHRAHQAGNGAVIAQRHVRVVEPAHGAIGRDPRALLVRQRAARAHRRRCLRFDIGHVLVLGNLRQRAADHLVAAPAERVQQRLVDHLHAIAGVDRIDDLRQAVDQRPQQHPLFFERGLRRAPLAPFPRLQQCAHHDGR